jgi:hypothetical protein
MWFAMPGVHIPRRSKRTNLSSGDRAKFGRQLQVIYVLKGPDEISYESLTVEDWMSVEAGEITVVVRIIHAMDLTPRMKRRRRKRRR